MIILYFDFYSGKKELDMDLHYATFDTFDIEYE